MKKIVQLILTGILLSAACTSPKQKEKVAQKPAITIDSSYYKEQLKSSSVKTSALNLKEVLTIKDVFNRFYKQPQIFHLTTSTDTVITCKEGTKLTIPANCFVTAEGKEVGGIVKFKTQEFYSKADILLAGLTTLSDGKLLESGGMLNMQAYAEGKELKLKLGTSIKIEMPAKNKKKDMQLFNGVKDKTGNINWVLTKNEQPSYLDIETNSYKEYWDSYEIIPAKTVLSSTMKVSQNNLLMERSYKHKYADNIISNEKINTYTIKFSIDRAGNIKLKQLAENGLELAVRRAHVNFVEWLPFNNSYKFVRTNKIDFTKKLSVQVEPGPMVPRFLNQVVIEKTDFDSLFSVSNDSSFEIEGTVCILRVGTMGPLLKEGCKDCVSTTIDSKKMRVSKNGWEYYVFSTNVLGYLNCDKFYNDPNPRTTIQVYGGQNAKVKMIFTELNSFLEPVAMGDVKRFNNIPENMRVKIVAIKVKDGIPYMAVKDMNTSEKNITINNYKEVTYDMIRKKAALINNL